MICQSKNDYRSVAAEIFVREKERKEKKRAIRKIDTYILFSFNLLYKRNYYMCMYTIIFIHVFYSYGKKDVSHFPFLCHQKELK